MRVSFRLGRNVTRHRPAMNRFLAKFLIASGHFDWIRNLTSGIKEIIPELTHICTYISRNSIKYNHNEDTRPYYLGISITTTVDHIRASNTERATTNFYTPADDGRSSISNSDVTI